MKIVGTLQNWKQEDLVGIVGPRKASMAECNVAYTLGKLAAEKGKIVVSGLAKGIDTYAHRGALAGGGYTIAIVSTSDKEKIYPKSNQSLAEKIKENGALIHPFDMTSSEGDQQFGIRKEHQPRYIIRLLERDILLAQMCPIIMAVSTKKATGGTRWALNYGVHFNKSVYQYNGEGKQIELNYAYDEVDWDMELDIPGVKK